MKRQRPGYRTQVRHVPVSEQEMSERLEHYDHAHNHPVEPDKLTPNELDSRVASIRFLYPDLKETLDLFEKRFEDLGGQNIQHVVELGHTALDHILEINSGVQ